MKTVGHYKLITDEKLGEGTLGKTFKACHQFKQQWVVMRVISKHKYRQSKHLKQTLKNQIEFLSKTRGQHIASFIQILETGNNFYLVRQLCNGHTLMNILSKKQSIQQSEVINYLVQILKGMFQLIKKGIVHKNLTPQNILFHNNILKISDFGIQKINHQILQQSQVKTYSQYKSPQILQGARGNLKCDIWALGIILYQLIYANHPWPSTNQNSLLTNINNQKLQFPKQISISKGLKKFIMSCLMIDPNQRAEWTQIFDSLILQGCGVPKLNNLNQKYGFILQLLKSNIIKSNLDVERYFKGLKMLSNNILSRKAFSDLIKPMAPDITDQQIQFLYTRLDKNADQQIQLSQFEQAMIEYEIPLQSTYRRKAQKLLKAKDMDKQLQQQQKKQQQLAFIYKGLIQNLQKKQIYDLYDLFTESDKKKLGVLTFDEFILMMRKIDKTLTKTQCQKVFKQFDKNQDMKISFNQFFVNMCKITGSPNGLGYV